MCNPIFFSHFIKLLYIRCIEETKFLTSRFDIYNINAKFRENGSCTFRLILVYFAKIRANLFRAKIIKKVLIKVCLNSVFRRDDETRSEKLVLGRNFESDLVIFANFRQLSVWDLVA